MASQCGLFVVPRTLYVLQTGRDASSLGALCAFNRINALTCIESAKHGWLGASYSVTEILTAAYFGVRECSVILSKGHAAAMQYACLFGLGLLDAAKLLGYKNGPSGLPAHSERCVPGVLFTSGSLGQALSRAAGIAIERPSEKLFVVLGDGELQEGQCFEAFQTVVHRKLSNIVTIVDLNGFQTDLPTSEVKCIVNYRSLFEGLGFTVREVDGHNVEALMGAFTAQSELPVVVLARTQKAGGTALLCEESGRQPWHGRVPSDELYRKIVEEQAALSGVDELRNEVSRFFSTSAPTQTPIAVSAAKCSSTRDGFMTALGELLPVHRELAVLDADLLRSCGLESLTLCSNQFFEMGISEQDMVSFAGGLAVAGRLPVVNTYAAFLKRAVDQIHLNQIDMLRIIYVGHYAGLCYYSDGKTHQSIEDLSLMMALPDLIVIEPPDARHAAELLKWVVEQANSSVYFRLRRTPIDLALEGGYTIRPDRPMHVGETRRLLWSMGSVSSRLAIDALSRPYFKGWGHVIQSVLRGPLDIKYYRALLRDTEIIVTIEEDRAPGALHSFVIALCQQLLVAPRVIGKSIDRWGHSFRSLSACLEHFDFTVEKLEALVAGRQVQ